MQPMTMADTETMVAWKLKDTMDANGITRYALQKDTGVAMNTLRDMYEGTTKRPDLQVLDTIIRVLRQKTSQPITLADILEWREHA